MLLKVKKTNLFPSLGLIFLLSTQLVLAQKDRGLNLDFNSVSPSTQRTPKVGGPSIQYTPPTTDGFFQKGRRIFPPNFQAVDMSAGAHLTDYQPGKDVTDEYPVGPGDRFLINFWGKIEDGIIVAINSNGDLFIPRIGVLATGGLTYGDLQKEISNKINAALKDVKFTISLLEPRSFKVYVLGAINKPGPITAQATMRASDIIANAGGSTATGSSQFIEVRRKGKTLRVDLIRFMAFGDFSMNPYLTDGDVLYVPNLTDFATISGAVVRTGTFELKETNKLDEILTLLGGMSVYADQTAPVKLSRLNSRGERETFLINRATAPRTSKKDLLISEVTLKHGDEVFVPAGQLLIPSKGNLVFITGEVKTPGAKPYVISSSAEEYIGLAGGLTVRANLASAVIYKADGTTVKLRPRVNIDPGDTIYIPERTFKFWQDHLAIITTFLSLATTVIAVTR